MPLRLYDGPHSPNCRKVRLLAAELGLPLERVILDPNSNECRSAEYLAKNPNGKVPTIDDDGFALWESSAILKYLAGKFPDRDLLSRDPRGLAELDQWLFWWTAHPEPALLSLHGERLVKPSRGERGNSASILEAEAALARQLPIFDRQLARGEYVLGKLSVVDFAAAPWLEFAPGLGVTLDPYAAIRRWLENLHAKPYWKDA